MSSRLWMLGDCSVYLGKLPFPWHCLSSESKRRFCYLLLCRYSEFCHMGFIPNNAGDERSHSQHCVPRSTLHIMAQLSDLTILKF